MTFKQFVLIVLLVASLGTGSWVGSIEQQNKAALLAETQSRAAIRLLENASLETTRLQAEKDKYQNEAIQKKQQLDATAARLGANVRSLQQQVTASSQSANNNSNSTCGAYTATLGEVFNECIQEYSELATKADGHVIDIESMIKFWKAVETKKD